MKKNMGIADRILRTLIAITIGLVYFAGYITGALGTILLIVAGVFLATSLFGVCPLYSLFGWDTHSKSTAQP